MRRKEQTMEFWKRLPPTLDSMFFRQDAASIEQKEREEILRYLPSFEGKRILELASGIGRYTSSFATQAQHLVSVDLNPSFLEKNKADNNQFTNVDYYCADAMDLTFRDDQFDLVFMNWLLMYLDDAELAVLSKRIDHWLKPGGILFFRESCTPSGFEPELNYYVNFRSIYFYTDLFDRSFVRIRQDSLQLYEKEFANPFQCFWIYGSRK
jgi:phosphoethanolamine N-methyltransferase